MSILEPGEAAIEEVEQPIIVPPKIFTTDKFIKNICTNCRRPLIELDRGWVHVDSRIDDPRQPAFCVPELYVEPDVRWGFLEIKGRHGVEPVKRSSGKGGAAA